MTVVVLNFHHRSTETKEMGPWVSATIVKSISVRWAVVDL